MSLFEKFLVFNKTHYLGEAYREKNYKNFGFFSYNRGSVF